MGTLTTWLRVMTRSKVSQQVFTTAAGKQGSRSRSRDRTCRVVVASLVPVGTKQRLSLWYPMAKPCLRQSPHDSAGADPWSWGEQPPLTSGESRATDRWLRTLQNTLGAPEAFHTLPSNSGCYTLPSSLQVFILHGCRAPHTQLKTPCSSAPHLQLFQSPARRTWRWRVLQGDAQELHLQT